MGRRTQMLSRRQYGRRDFGSLVTPPTASVTVDDVVHSIFGDPAKGVPYASGSTLYAANDEPMAILNQGFDWAKGAALHAAPSPANSWSGAPWSYGGDSGFQWFNVWLECVASALTQPRGVRIQFAVPRSFTIPSNLSAWTEQHPNAAADISGGFWHTTNRGGDPSNYGKTLDWGSTYWRTEPSGGGVSINLDPMTDASGHVRDDYAVTHGPWSDWVMPGRVKVPTGGHVAVSSWARLISDTGADLSSAHYVACISADAFVDNTTGPGAVTTSLLNSRHRRITSSWTWLGFVTGSEAMIRSYPTLPFLGDTPPS